MLAHQQKLEISSLRTFRNLTYTFMGVESIDNHFYHRQQEKIYFKIEAIQYLFKVIYLFVVVFFVSFVLYQSKVVASLFYTFSIFKGVGLSERNADMSLVCYLFHIF